MKRNDDNKKHVELLKQAKQLQQQASTLQEKINSQSVELADTRRQLFHAQKLEGFEVLAAGIAHDFNNTLVGIMGHANLIRFSCDKQSEIYNSAAIIEQVAQTAADLSRQLLDFARSDPSAVRTPVNLNRVVRDTLHFLHGNLSPRIEVVDKLSPKIGQVSASSVQMGQVIMNLCLNARDAMPGGGRLTIETRPSDMSQAYWDVFPRAKPTDYLQLIISDTGCGINRETIDHVLKPFFTTKSTGSGLGLANVRSIIEQHGGSLDIDSSAGVGTTITIMLPTTEQQPIVNEMDGGTYPGGDETIIVAEYDVVVLQTVAAMLHRLGYNVITRRRASMVLEDCRQRSDVALILTANRLFDAEAKTLIDACRERFQNIKVIVSTDEPDGPVPEGARAAVGRPIGMRELSRTVRAVLDGSPLHTDPLASFEL